MFGLIDRLLVAACVLLLAAALMALGALGYSFIDQHNSREFHAVATVQAVTYRAPHTSLFLVGKVLVPVRHSAS